MANDCWGPDLNPPYPLGRAAREVNQLAAEYRGRFPATKTTVTKDGITIDYGENGEDVDAHTDDARYILGTVMPHLLKLFLEKNRKYASVEKGYDLGASGIIPDINRKVGILVDRLWHGNAEIGESTDEVIDDLIGHLLLMKAKRRHE